MISALTLIAGAVLLAVGYLIGVAVGRRGTAAPRPPTAQDTECGCGHQLAYHDLDEGMCNAEHARSTWNAEERRNFLVHVKCPCIAYSGALPADRFFTRPVLPPTT